MATKSPVELQVLEASDEASGSALSDHAIEVPPESIQVPTSTPQRNVLSHTKSAVVISHLVGVQLFTSFCNGVVVVGLPTIADSLHLEAGLLLWPTSVFYLTAGSCLMLAASIAEVVGTKPTIIAANVLLVGTALGCALSTTGGELIAFRALQGVVNAMVVPASVSIISTSVPFGRPRNLGFGCLGFSGPLGFLLGLVLGGVMIDFVGWPPAFYLAAGASGVLGLFGLWVLPARTETRTARVVVRQLLFEMDWVGTLIISAGVAMFSYVLAELSASTQNIHRAYNIALLALSGLSIPAFAWWMNFQVQHSRPALIPNVLWRKTTFTSICIMIVFATAVTNSMELYSSLYFQQVQGNTSLGAAIRIIPALVMGIVTNLSTGYFVDRLPIMWVVIISAVISALSPLFMTLNHPSWSYWDMAFLSQVFQPICSDVLFTVGLLVISAVFSPNTQALGGAVFNTCSQLGTSLGLTITSAIADSTTDGTHYANKMLPAALLAGYRAVFWALFAWTVSVGVIGAFGLRRLGRIGTKQE